MRYQTAAEILVDRNHCCRAELKSPVLDALLFFHLLGNIPLFVVAHCVRCWVPPLPSLPVACLTLNAVREDGTPDTTPCCATLCLDVVLLCSRFTASHSIARRLFDLFIYFLLLSFSIRTFSMFLTVICKEQLPRSRLSLYPISPQPHFIIFFVKYWSPSANQQLSWARSSGS